MHEDIEDLIEARDRGDFRGKYLEIVVDNDSVRARLYDRPPDEWGADEDIEPEYIANLGQGNP